MKTYTLTFMLAASCAFVAPSAFAEISVTGSDADKAALVKLLTAATGTNVGINAQGKLTIANGGNGCAGILRSAITEATAVTLNIARDTATLAGGFNGTDGTTGTKTTGTQDIDLTDMEKFGTDNDTGNFSRGSAMMHEIWEVILSKKLSIPFDDVEDPNTHVVTKGAHKRAIEDCENGYYTAMSQSPTKRDCKGDAVRDHGDGTYNAYVPFTRGSDGKKGFSCLPIRFANGKWNITGAPTFVEGATPPEQQATAGGNDLKSLGVPPGPLYGSNCIGACCLGQSGCLEPMIADTCTAINGDFQGDDTTTCNISPSGECVPALSAWGVSIAALLAMIAGTVAFGRKLSCPIARLL